MRDRTNVFENPAHACTPARLRAWVAGARRGARPRRKRTSAAALERDRDRAQPLLLDEPALALGPL
jgi:hypothetical protein